MKITRDNYELYFLDFIEGRMSEQEKNELFLFLGQNPDLKSELEDYDQIYLKPVTNAGFENKESVKKGGVNEEINESNFEQFCIAAAENDLSDEKKTDLLKFIGNNSRRENTLMLYSKIKLSADKDVLFERKDQLYKRVVSFSARTVYSAISVAAVILVIFSANFFLDSHNDYVTSPQEYISDMKPESFIADTIIKLPENEVNIEVLQSDKTVHLAEGEAEGEKQEEKYTERQKVHTETGRLFARANTLPPKPIPAERKVSDPSEMAHRLNNTSTVPGKYSDNRDFSFYNFTGEVAELFNSDILSRNEGRITAWDIADAGLRGFSRLTGKEVNFDKDVDEDGRIVALVIETESFGFSRVKGKK